MPFVALADVLLGLFLQKEEGEVIFQEHRSYGFLFDRLSHLTLVILYMVKRKGISKRVY